MAKFSRSSSVDFVESRPEWDDEKKDVVLAQFSRSKSAGPSCSRPRCPPATFPIETFNNIHWCATGQQKRGAHRDVRGQGPVVHLLVLLFDVGQVDVAPRDDDSDEGAVLGAHALDGVVQALGQVRRPALGALDCTSSPNTSSGSPSIEWNAIVEEQSECGSTYEWRAGPSRRWPRTRTWRPTRATCPSWPGSCAWVGAGGASCASPECCWRCSRPFRIYQHLPTGIIRTLSFLFSVLSTNSWP